MHDLVDRGAPQLLDRLAHVRHPDDVRLGQIPAVRVHGDRPARPADVAIGNERSTLADAAEAVVLELHQHHRGEVVVQQGDVDIARLDACHRVRPLGNRPVPRRHEVLVGHVHPGDRLTPAPHAPVGRAHDVDRRLAQVLGTLRSGRDDRNRAVGFEAEVVEAERFADHASAEVVVARQGLTHQ